MRVLVFIVCVIFLAACSNTVEMPSPETAILPEAIPTIDPADEYMASAQFNYNRYCAHCHGYGGEGQHPDTIERTQELGYHLVPAHDASGHTWQHPDQLIFETIKYGVEAPANFYQMVAFDGTLTHDEIFGVIDYMRLWWTDEQVAWQAQLSTQFTENNPNWTPDRFSEEQE